MPDGPSPLPAQPELDALQQILKRYTDEMARLEESAQAQIQRSLAPLERVRSRLERSQALLDGLIANRVAPMRLQEEQAARLAEVPLSPDRWRTHHAAGRSNKHYTVAAMLDMTGLSKTSLNRYAKRAAGPTPRRGQRNFCYPAIDAWKILVTILDVSSERTVRERCSASLEVVTKEIAK